MSSPDSFDSVSCPHANDADAVPDAVVVWGWCGGGDGVVLEKNQVDDLA